jgi:outer membrane lipoprotein carrier protein
MGEEAEEASGTVAFKKPGKMRWEFARPERQSIISDGKTLWVYQPAETQVLRAPFSAAFVSTTPVSFLTGVGRIADDFDAEPDRRGCDAARIRVRLVPRRTPDLGSLTLAMTRPQYDIVEAEVTDPIGNVTTLTFAAVARNVDVPDEEFRFVPPAGVDVVDAPGAAGAP